MAGELGWRGAYPGLKAIPVNLGDLQDLEGGSLSYNDQEELCFQAL